MRGSFAPPGVSARVEVGFQPVRAKGVGVDFVGALPEAGAGVDAGALGFAVVEGAVAVGLGVALGVGVASKAGSQDWSCARRNGSPYSVSTRLLEPSGDIVNSAPS